jgi:hypothetical protein
VIHPCPLDAAPGPARVHRLRPGSTTGVIRSGASRPRYLRRLRGQTAVAKRVGPQRTSASVTLTPTCTDTRPGALRATRCKSARAPGRRPTRPNAPRGASACRSRTNWATTPGHHEGIGVLVVAQQAGSIPAEVDEAQTDRAHRQRKHEHGPHPASTAGAAKPSHPGVSESPGRPRPVEGPRQMVLLSALGRLTRVAGRSRSLVAPQIPRNSAPWVRAHAGHGLRGGRGRW